MLPIILLMCFPDPEKKDQNQGPTLHLVVITPESLSTQNSFVLLCFVVFPPHPPWLWQFWRSRAIYLVECPIIWGCVVIKKYIWPLSLVPATELLKPLDFLSSSNVFVMLMWLLNPEWVLLSKERTKTKIKPKSKTNHMIRGLEISAPVERTGSGDWVLSPIANDLITHAYMMKPWQKSFE